MPKQSKLRSNKIIRVFLQTNMSYAHDGLALLAAKEKVDLLNLGYGEFVVFINKACTKVKVFGANNTFAYYSNRNRKIDLSMIQKIPEVFNGVSFDFTKAIESVLLKSLKKQ